MSSPAEETRLVRWGQPAAGLFAVVAVVSLWLPWWRSAITTYAVDADSVTNLGRDSRDGFAVVGPLGAALIILGALACAVVIVNTLRGTTGRAVAWWCLAALGVIAATIGLASTADWGWQVGSVLLVVAGLAVLAGSLVALVRPRTGRSRAVPAVVLVLALPVWFVPAEQVHPQPDESADGGSFELVAATLDDDEALRTGDPGLAPTSDPSVVVPYNDDVAVTRTGGLVTIDEDGRQAVVARIEAADTGADNDFVYPLGVAGDRLVVHLAAADQVLVVPLGSEQLASSTVSTVYRVGKLSADGVIWLSVGPGEPLRQLDVTTLAGGESVDATELEPVQVGDLGSLVEGAMPVDGGLVLSGGVSGPGALLQRFDAETGAVDTLAGGVDPACGLTSDPRQSYFDAIGEVTADGAGGWWLMVRQDDANSLVHLSRDGRLRALAVDWPKNLQSMRVDGAGNLAVLATGGLWRLLDPRSRLTDLPAPKADCAAQPANDLPAELTPIEGADAEGWPLDVRGRTAKTVAEGGAVEMSAPGGAQTTLGQREDDSDNSERLVPDGSGGVWWLERRREGPVSDAKPGTPTTFPPTTYRLAHATAAGEVTRLPEMVDTNAGSASVDIVGPDFSTGTPLVNSPSEGLLRIQGQQAVAVTDAYVTAGVIGANGRGWLLADGTLLSVSGSQVTPVIEPGPGGGGPETVPVSVQLAHGTAPSELSLPHGSSLGLAADGRLLVLSDTVLLAVTADGQLSVAARDERLAGLSLASVEGGCVAHGNGQVFRLG